MQDTEAARCSWHPLVVYANGILQGPEGFIMKWITSCCARLASVVCACLLTSISLFAQSNAPTPSFGVCKPVSERTTEIGCWILVDQPVGRIEQAEVFWHLDVYPSRTEAEKAKGARGTVIESLGKVWLLTIEKVGWRPTVKGERIAEIGPLPVTAGEQYSAVFMEAIFNPGMTSSIHTHSGPEAWYTQAGETCLETPTGKLVGGAGSPPVIVPGGPPMLLTATGTEQRRAITLILHESSKPPTTVIHDWTPKGLCKLHNRIAR
jgi:quercetin dioxygenase-like cupin family protein